MIRIVSPFCVGLLGFTIISAYHVSEQTRIAKQELVRSEKQIQAEETQISVLEAQWQKAANPETIQKLAESSLGMANTTTAQLASVTMLPRRSDALNGEEMQQASAQASVATPSPVVKISARSGM
jgi:cell division protein FtsL